MQYFHQSFIVVHASRKLQAPGNCVLSLHPDRQPPSEAAVLTLCDRSQLERLITKNYFLHQSAKEAFRAYVHAYNSHSLKAIFDIEQLDLKSVGRSFGFTVPPAVELKAHASKEGRARKRGGGGGAAFVHDEQRKAKKAKIFSRPKPGKGFVR